MKSVFNTIGIISKHHSYNIKATILAVYHCLQALNITIIIDEETALATHQKNSFVVYPKEQIAKHCDLIIVIGGDGYFLSAARAILDYNIPIVGINRGNLGFLTDISPKEISQKLTAVINGNYTEEDRFLFHCEIIEEKTSLATGIALNDVVLLPGDVAQMIEFEVYIDNKFVCYHRADGIIVATPTGSTAYALSGGGPILYPCLEAVVLVPMFPHTLSSRPLVVHSDSIVELYIPISKKTPPRVSFDGQARLPVPHGSRVKITKHPSVIRVIHPPGYDFYETMRTKLGWESKNPFQKI